MYNYYESNALLICMRNIYISVIHGPVIDNQTLWKPLPPRPQLIILTSVRFPGSFWMLNSRQTIDLPSFGLSSGLRSLENTK